MSRNPTQSDWHPASWQNRTASQMLPYPDETKVADVLSRLSRLPPLVTSWEVERLKSELAEAQRGERFLLQGGDCAERFDECNSDLIAKKLKILMQMSLVLLYGLKKPLVRVGRIAGQYAKPRSTDTETRDGLSLPTFRGDLINKDGFTTEDRTPDPELMLEGYVKASLSLNFIRALLDSGFADLHHPEYWDLDFASHSPLEDEYRRIVSSISDSMDFFESISGRSIHQTTRVAMFTSHEGLHLPYEQAQTRYIPRWERWYNLATHFPWIGMRTGDLDGAHVEYFRGISNPLGIKVGPGMTGESLQKLLEVLNPLNEPGRITLIHRFGVSQIKKRLPSLIRAVQATGSPVLWCCDPMHGNTEVTADGVKTRRFDNILDELEMSFDIHDHSDSHLGGVHFEMTGEDVTECTGGARGLTDADLARAYKSQVDPRLNYEQALELAMRITGKNFRSTASQDS
ncbi:MAG: 3-deoxy-7-phosphoheptulonate synthase class II [Gammaproteobacteria bacterium]|nr:3-deoxy-7-phosphoheptulonate synthase class II [Gammaproteobacteria bacterium]